VSSGVSKKFITPNNRTEQALEQITNAVTAYIISYILLELQNY